jgi:hypothetical protein
MSTVEAVSTGVGERFLEALGRRDYDGIAACFARHATLRAIVPPGLREDEGPEAIVQRFRIWTEEIDNFELVGAEATPFADLLRLRWSVRGLDPSAAGERPTTFEQTAYAEVADGVITKMRLACSGDRPAG